MVKFVNEKNDSETKMKIEDKECYYDKLGHPSKEKYQHWTVIDAVSGPCDAVAAQACPTTGPWDAVAVQVWS